jgi:hypothetical protein
MTPRSTTAASRSVLRTRRRVDIQYSICPLFRGSALRAVIARSFPQRTLPKNSMPCSEFPVLIGRTSSTAVSRSHVTGSPHRHSADHSVAPRHAPSQPPCQHAVPVTVQEQSSPSEQRQPTIHPPRSWTWQSPEAPDTLVHWITGSVGQTAFPGAYFSEIALPVVRLTPSIELTASRIKPLWRSFWKRSLLNS